MQYIYGKYGRERAGITATVISYRGRSAIREVGKVFGLSEDTVGALSSSIWGGGGGACAQDAVKRTGLDPQSRRMREIDGLAKEIDGFPRHLSQHVGGFVITRSRLDEVMPIMNAAMAERTAVEWDKDDLDALGILKVDMLGLGMLSLHPQGAGSGGEALSVGFAARATKAERASRALSPRGRGLLRSSKQRDRVRGASLPPHPTVPVEQLRRCPLPQAGRGQQRRPPDLSSIPAEDPAVYRMLAAPIRSACSRSRAARRCPCCRG